MPGTKGRSGGDRKSAGKDMFPANGKPQPPKGLTKDERAVWKQLMDQLPAEMLRSVDCHRLAQLCRCFVDAQECHERYLKTRDTDFKESQAWLRACRQAEAEAGKLSVQYGLTPKDRQSIKFEKTVTDNVTEWMNS